MSKRTMVAAMVVLAWVIATGCGGTACKVYGDPCYSTAECCGGSVIAPLVCGSTASNPDWTCNFGDATTCGNWMSCSKGSWKACSTTTSSYYESSDGTRFQCASRADCNDAINKIIAWCGDDGCGPSNCAGCCSAARETSASQAHSRYVAARTASLAEIAATASTGSVMTASAARAPW